MSMSKTIYAYYFIFYNTCTFVGLLTCSSPALDSEHLERRALGLFGCMLLISDTKLGRELSAQYLVYCNESMENLQSVTVQNILIFRAMLSQ